MDKQPNSLEAEQNVLGAILYSPERFSEVHVILSDSDFYRPSHRYIYRAMVDLFNSKEPIDILTVSEYLAERDQLAAAHGRTYIMDLSMMVATAENVKYYAKMVKATSLRRRLMTICQNVIYESAEYPDIEKPLKSMVDGVKELSSQLSGETDPTHAQLVEMVLEKMENDLNSPGGISGIKTGFPSLDAMLGGLEGGMLHIIAGRPSMGKSAFAINIAQNAARFTSKSVLFLTCEMTPQQIVRRALIADAGVNARDQTAEDLEKLREQAEKISFNFHVLDRPGLTLTKVRSSLLKYQNEGSGVCVVVIDHLQLMKPESGGKNMNRHLELGLITRTLKEIAKEYNVCILLLSQLSRAVEQRADKTPQLSDLRESGSIEEDADSVMFIYREEYYNRDTERPGVTDIIIPKNRDRPVGSIPLLFQKNIVKFKEPLMSSVKVY